MGRQVRTHANPLAYRGPVVPPDWGAVFEDPDLPLAIEFGSGKGRFLVEHAEVLPGINILGTEIRRPLVSAIEEKLRRRGLKNAHIVWANIAPAIEDYLGGKKAVAVYALFPDPWFKKRHHKRRLFTPSFVEALARILEPGGEVHLETDQKALFDEIMGIIEACRSFENAFGAFTCAPGRTAPAASDWELHCERTGRPFWRLLFRRKA